VSAIPKICTEAFSIPADVPSGSGNVSSAASSNPTGRRPVMKNLPKKIICFGKLVKKQILIKFGFGGYPKTC
jgi:hypothetical protein